MIGIDTNILVRAILEDDTKQAKIAQSLLKKLTSITAIIFVVYCALWVKIEYKS